MGLEKSFTIYLECNPTPKIKITLHPKKINYFSNKYQALQNSNALIIPTEWSEFKNIDFEIFHSKMSQKIIIDGRNILNPLHLKKEGINYYGISRGNLLF